MPTRVDPEYVSARWLGDHLDVQPRTVRDMSRRGLFPAYRLSPKVVRYKLAEVLAAMEVR